MESNSRQNYRSDRLREYSERHKVLFHKAYAPKSIKTEFQRPQCLADIIIFQKYLRRIETHVKRNSHEIQECWVSINSEKIGK